MAVGSKELTAEKLDQLDSEHLLEELKKAKEELFNLRFQSATGQLESHGRLRSVKKDIARIYTILRERELGIRVEPVSVVEEPKAAKKSKKADAAAEAKPAAAEATEAEATEEAAK
ncbi:50S ribosomal protein L29 [Sinomonas sp. ASV322]|uniref:50S ribosomal protein L29 n=1 Tax=Sinomonas sp. ASV322 TaxID=3041920 RepID=UPI0027DD8B7C|nr:50S ribosomal protein L29 [Sinomonas sp. ASV322]MDQ4501833.1 50S ribosomal protein L29 [Sinomonas sp. ASV322]